MMALDLCKLLERNARQYRQDAIASLYRNKHMRRDDFDTVLQPAIDAVLTDFINYVAREQGIDLALYDKDLQA